MTYAIIFLVMILGGIVQGMCGFGGGLVCMSILPFIFDYKTALPVVFVAGGVINLYLLLKTHRHINWKLFLMPAVFSALGRAFSMLVVTNLDSTILKFILGSIIISTALYQLAFHNKLKIKANHKNGAIAGTLSGLMGGLASTGGPPLVVYYMNCELEKDEYLSTLQITFFTGTLFSISLTAASGGYSGGVFLYIIPAVVGIISGALIGRRVFNKISKEQLKKIINMVLLVLGISLLVKTLISLLA